MPHPITVTRKHLDLSTLSSGTRAVLGEGRGGRGGGGGEERGREGEREGGREGGGGRYCATRNFKAQNFH